MKKNIFFGIAAAFSLVACDPVQEDFSNGGSISLVELKAKTSITVDVAESGKNGNCITCETSAPVSAKWDVGGKEFIGNFAWKKMKLGEHKVVLTAICADGTELVDSVTLVCEEITDSLTKFYIYGEDPEKEPPFKPGAWDAAAMRFSDTEGRCLLRTETGDTLFNEKGEPKYTNLPFLKDAVYAGKKTLIFNITDISDDCALRVMNGWWSATYADGIKLKDETKNGLWELPLTDAINKDCSKNTGCDGKDLDLMLTSGSCTVKSVYYEE